MSLTWYGPNFTCISPGTGFRVGVLAVLDALHKRGGTVTDTDDGDNE